MLKAIYLQNCDYLLVTIFIMVHTICTNSVMLLLQVKFVV